MEQMKKARHTLLIFLFGAACLTVFSPMETNRKAHAFQNDPGVRHRWGRAADQFMDSLYRIDIKNITVTFDYYPESSYADALARVEFVMRPGQNRPLIHFDPAIRYNAVNSISLNGESLNISQTSDVRILEYADTTQDALEFQRDLPSGVNHTLDISYRLILPEIYPRFSTEVNDIEGRGNEEIFPTLNTPHELARHTLTFRVHSSRAFRCIGSGYVVKTGAGLQEWILDTEREIASYTLMFVLIPEEDTILEERNIAGVDVSILAFIGGASVSDAFTRLVPWLTELAVNLGPFPMPRGISIFLVSSGGGMEYYGGTISSLRVLLHEVFHMYYGCSAVMSTYRDTWLDEAVNMWYERSMDPSYSPIGSDYLSNIVSGRPPEAVGFDIRAYDEGARIIEAVARELGGRSSMIAFLRYVHQYKQFSPFTTWDFLDFLENFSGVDMRDQFNNWLFLGGEANRLYERESHFSLRVPDISPPASIRQKYETADWRKK
jgi:aminopeptidase N